MELRIRALLLFKSHIYFFARSVYDDLVHDIHNPTLLNAHLLIPSSLKYPMTIRMLLDKCSLHLHSPATAIHPTERESGRCEMSPKS